MFTVACLILSWQHNKSEVVENKMKIAQFLKSHLKTGSVILQRLSQTTTNEKWSRFTKTPSEEFTVINLEKSITGKGTNGYVTKPKLILPLKGWMSYLSSQNHTPMYAKDSSTVCVLLETQTPDDLESFCSESLSIPQHNRVDVVDIASPLAWRSGEPFGILVECGPDQFINLADAFMNGFLTAAESLQITKLISVEVKGKPNGLLRTKSYTDNVNVFHTPIGSNDDLTNNLRLSMAAMEETESINTSDQLNDDVNERCDNDISISRDSDTSISRDSDTIGQKPPNVLIYCGKVDSNRIFQSIKSIVQCCLNIDCYTIYHLKFDDISRSPWKDNTCLLIIAAERLDSSLIAQFQDYLQNGGNIISFCSSIDQQFVAVKPRPGFVGIISLQYQSDSVHVICGKYVYCQVPESSSDKQYQILARDSTTSDAVVIHVSNSSGNIILSQVHLEKDPMEFAITPDLFATLKKSNEKKLEILRDLFLTLNMNCDKREHLDSTPFFLLATSQAKSESFLSSIRSRLDNGKLKSRKLTLEFLNNDEKIPEKITDTQIPVITNSQSKLVGFNHSVYKHHLLTRTLGNIVLYSEVTSTTMNLFDGFMFSIPDNVGMIAIAGRQIGGKGRGGNTWLGPIGCAMFSFHIRHLITTNIGSSPTFIQHIASLSLVHAIKNTPGYQDLDLRLKWPNDIYYGNHMKLGGVLVNCTSMNNVIHAIIGCGFNVNNKHPLICLNDIIERHNIEHQTKLNPFSIEEFIAKALTEFELLSSGFQANGVDWFLNQYYHVWLHSYQAVNIEIKGEYVSATVNGLDKYGYLSVAIDNGDIVSVQPDGNSFDMMKNLICPKR